MNTSRMESTTTDTAADLNPPHGGTLVDLLVSPERAAELKAASRDWPSWDLTPRQFCDLELLLNGGFSPLTGFMGKADYDSVCASMRLADGTLWPIPITLDVPGGARGTAPAGTSLALRDPEGVMLAALHVEEIWGPDREAEAQAIFGTTRPRAPRRGAPAGQDASRLRGRPAGGAAASPSTTTSASSATRRPSCAPSSRGWAGAGRRLPDPQPHAPRAPRAGAARRPRSEANLLIHPIVGMTKPGDLDHYTRVRCYQAVLPRFPQHTAKLSLLPLAMRMGGPREALLHAIIRKNYGCTHFIVGRDHAGPGSDSTASPSTVPTTPRSCCASTRRSWA